MIVGIAGLIASAMSLLLFRTLPLVMLIGLVVGLQASAYAWLTEWRRLALVGALAAVVPSAIAAIQSRSWELGVAPALCLAATAVGAGIARRRAILLVQANPSLERP
jgi:hypothetical protein